MSDAAYYAAHRDEVLARGAAYRRSHREQIAAWKKAHRPSPDVARQHYAANRERLLAQAKRRRELDPEKFRARDAANDLRRRDAKRAYNKAYRAAHAAEILERNAKYAADHPDWYLAQKRASGQRRQANKRGASGDATPTQIAARVALWGGKCWMCGAAYEHIDHVKPLAKGGSNWPANLRPACAHCNSSKRDSWPLMAA